MLKALDIVWLTCLLSAVWRTKVQVPNFRRRAGGWAAISRLSGCSASLAKFTPGCWKGGSNWLSSFYFVRQNVDSALTVDQWNSSLPLQVVWGHLVSLLIKPTCALWTWRKPMGDIVGIWGTGSITKSLLLPIWLKWELYLHSWQKVKHISSWCWSLLKLHLVSVWYSGTGSQDTTRVRRMHVIRYFRYRL